ncbi:MAG: zinc ribbon domain-containing protein [Clostridiales bacterium]|nr:zinc ribbon domain-containing protein [Clostridiales bacterium]
MFCDNCGNEIKDNVKFCPFCGASFAAPPRQEEVLPANAQLVLSQPVLPQQEDASSADAQTAPVQKRPRKKSKVKVVLLIIVLVLALTAAAGTVIFFTSPARQLSQSLSDGDYNSAMTTYLTSVSDSSIQKWLATQLL